MKDDNLLGQEKGMVLVVAVLLMAILLVLGVVAMVTTSTGLRTTGLFKSDKQAFHVAEAGIEDAKTRLRSGAASPILDNHPTQSGWSAFIGTSASAQGKGYNSGNAMHVRVDRLQTNLDYVVKIVHATDGSGNVLYWGM
jgi:Tfp pilus assembly protein PilX